MSRFQDINIAPSIEVFQLRKLFEDDNTPNKVDLSIGAYRNEDGLPWVLPVVKKMEQQMAEDETLLHEYLPALGMEQFSQMATAMLLGRDNSVLAAGRAFGIQSVGCTGALSIGAEFLSKYLGYTIYYCSKPTWEGHVPIFDNSGFTTGRWYRYWDVQHRTIDFEGLMEDLGMAPENSVIILHACAHNPTGIDPNHAQWEKIADIMEERKLFPFFDSSYQGFASGDLEKDAYAVRYFVKRGFELLCAQSFAKDFGVSNERMGNLVFVVSDVGLVPAIKSQLSCVVRGQYSSPPAQGARIICATLTCPHRFDQWKEHIRVMSSRIIQMREALRAELVKLGTPGTWEHIVLQIGLFSYTGLSQKQVEHLVKEFHIYLLKSGRINVCGLTLNNVGYVARAMNDAIVKFPDDTCLCSSCR